MSNRIILSILAFCLVVSTFVYYTEDSKASGSWGAPHYYANFVMGNGWKIRQDGSKLKMDIKLNWNSIKTSPEYLNGNIPTIYDDLTIDRAVKRIRYKIRWWLERSGNQLIEFQDLDTVSEDKDSVLQTFEKTKTLDTGISSPGDYSDYEFKFKIGAYWNDPVLFAPTIDLLPTTSRDAPTIEYENGELEYNHPESENDDPDDPSDDDTIPEPLDFGEQTYDAAPTNFNVKSISSDKKITFSWNKPIAGEDITVRDLDAGGGNELEVDAEFEQYKFVLNVFTHEKYLTLRNEAIERCNEKKSNLPGLYGDVDCNKTGISDLKGALASFDGNNNFDLEEKQLEETRQTYGFWIFDDAFNRKDSISDFIEDGQTVFIFKLGATYEAKDGENSHQSWWHYSNGTLVVDFTEDPDNPEINFLSYDDEPMLNPYAYGEESNNFCEAYKVELLNPSTWDNTFDRILCEVIQAIADFFASILTWAASAIVSVAELG